ncbi:AGROH133_08824 family phage infection protein [Rhizobium oryzicola]|uniref:DUF4345 domain-containing protein n=1 Tax=Rhizobium oryzicola TaxID=1232668 RepID=A0ABT8T009_9HYPH|nr:DUF4345 domain-containing protein [Rhizobium oryzicola]MDO1584042.1 DUF4345 domain-containing protein [Rhizobium oryzicola]
MDFYFPTELPERIAFIASALTAIIGLFILLLPAQSLRIAGFSVGGITGDGYGSVRSTGGLYLGLGLCAILLAQNWTYLALGASLSAAAIGRLLSMLFDRGLSPRNFALLLLQVALGALPLAYVFGYIPSVAG